MNHMCHRTVCHQYWVCEYPSYIFVNIPHTYLSQYSERKNNAPMLAFFIDLFLISSALAFHEMCKKLIVTHGLNIDFQCTE